MSFMEIEADLKAQIEALKGKALAAARAQAQAERERDKATEAAQVYRDETDIMIATTGEHMRQAFAVGLGIWSLAQWANSMARKKDLALRLLHREDSMVKVLSEFVNASTSGNKSAIEGALREASKICTIFKANQEKLNKERWETIILQAGEISKTRMDLIQEILSSPED